MRVLGTLPKIGKIVKHKISRKKYIVVSYIPLEIEMVVCSDGNVLRKFYVIELEEVNKNHGKQN